MCCTVLCFTALHYAMLDRGVLHCAVLRSFMSYTLLLAVLYTIHPAAALPLPKPTLPTHQVHPDWIEPCRAMQWRVVRLTVVV